MRSILLTLGALLLLVGGFALFMHFQPPPPKLIERKPTTASTTYSGNDESVVGRGDGLWIQTYDKDSEALVNEFRAARYDPPVNGVVKVDQPEGRFYTRDGGVLTVAAVSGEVVMADPGQKSKMDGLQGRPPSRGVLRDVTISLLPDPDSAATLVCTVPIISFDNDTLRMNTIETQINGIDVLGDRVPVTVRGDYEFDGQGLTLQWNQREQRLERLEIAHGKRLLVKNGGKFTGATGRSGAATDVITAAHLTREPLVVIAAADDETAVKLADDERAQREAIRQRNLRRAAATQRAATQAATQRSGRPAVAYLGTFSDNVEIFEGTKSVGTADEMRVTFGFERDNSAATQPTTVPTSRPTRRVAATRPATQSTTQPATSPTTRSTVAEPAEPVEVHWTGKLVVVPMKLADAGLQSGGDRKVEFVGSPVKLQRDGAEIEAASVSAGDEPSRFAASGNEKFPLVTLKDASGMLLKTPSIWMSGDQIALIGPSTADVQIEDDKAAKQPLAVQWTDKAVMDLITLPDGKRGIKHATFDGSVNVAHPQLKMKAGSLQLAFDPSAEQQPTLSEIIGRGGVRLTTEREPGKPQTLTADEFTAATAQTSTGGITLKSMTASRNVRLEDAGQSLAADQLMATFKPATDKNAGAATADIESMRAEGNVALRNGDSLAEADALVLETASAKQTAVLTGRPATAADKTTKLSGNTLRVGLDGSAALVEGPGSLTGLARSTDAQPATLSWSQSLTYDSAANRVEVLGDVSIQSRSRDGSLEQAKGKKLVLLLADAAAKPAATQPTTQSSSSLMGGKVMKQLTLSDDVEVTSVLNAADDASKLLRQVYLHAPQIDVFAAADGTVGKVVIPSAGELLYEDRQTNPTTKPAGPLKAANGAVAIGWSKSMTYDAAAGRVVLEGVAPGRVAVARQAPGQEVVTLRSDRLVADLADAKSPADSRLKQVRVEGGVSLETKGTRMDAGVAVYSPQANSLTVRGVNGQPVQVQDGNGMSKGAFEEVIWNLQSNRPERFKNMSGTLRR